MSEKRLKILTVDDEVFNLDILQTDLEEAGYEVIRAPDGVTALARLKEVPDISLIVLDRMMPNMDGMQVIKTLKGNPLYKDIPVIMQTAAGQSQQVREGLAAGVYYYLIKPYDESLLVSIVRTALRETVSYKDILRKFSSEKKLYGLMERAHFRFRTLQDVSSVAYCVARCCPKPDNVVYGLNELMVNAVEHGNLNISYMEKKELILEDCWQQEVERRLALAENINKYAYLTFETDAQNITITIRDQGKGFKWQSYIDFDPLRMVSDPHGKGIAIAKATSFNSLEYKAGGSEVVCRISG